MAIREALTEQVGKGPVPLEGELSWQLLRGMDGSEANTVALNTAATLLQVAVLLPAGYPAAYVSEKDLCSACQQLS